MVRNKFFFTSGVHETLVLYTILVNTLKQNYT